jgi:hypothetical protein
MKETKTALPPVEYVIEPSSGLVIVTAHGKVSMADRYEFTDRIAFDDELPHNSNVLIDVRGELQHPTDAEIGWMVVLLEEMRKHFARRVAFLTKPNDRDYEIVSAFASDVVGGVRAFDSEKAAREWLISEESGSAPHTAM